MSSRPPAPVVFDTDIGTSVDDALALGLALASPEIDLRGVVVGSGDGAVLIGRSSRNRMGTGCRSSPPAR